MCKITIFLMVALLISTALIACGASSTPAPTPDPVSGWFGDAGIVAEQNPMAGDVLTATIVSFIAAAWRLLLLIAILGLIAIGWSVLGR